MKEIDFLILALIFSNCLGITPCTAEDTGTTLMQYFRPEGDYFVGDCMPFSHEGVFHLYYLLDENHHQGKGGLGGHQWAHASTTDLITWQHHPLAIGITDDWEGSICTGSVFYYDGLYRGYYATRKTDGTEHLSVAISKDGIHFEKTEPRLFASPEGPYRTGPYRDPFVFRDERTGLFHLLATGELREPVFPGLGGCLAHLVSQDLKQWKTESPFLVPGYKGQPECSELFEWNGWYYLVFSLNGIAQYRMSRDPLGPWTRLAVDMLDSPMARVMKTAAFGEGRRIGAAFLPTLEGNKDNGHPQYAGCVVFREIVQDANGLLLTKFPAEMTPQGGPPVELGIPEDAEVKAESGYNALPFQGCPVDARITCEISPSGAAEFGLGLRASLGGDAGYQLVFSPGLLKADVRPCALGNYDDNGRRAIFAVDGLDRPFGVEIVMKGDIIDVALETDCQKRCLINRFPEQRGDTLFLFVRDGSATFRDIRVCPLLDQ